MLQVKKAVIPAAGLGTRFLPASKAIPKEMIPIIDKPMIQYNVEECARAGIEEIILITSEGKESIERHFSPDPKLESFLISKDKSDLLVKTQETGRLVKIIPVMQNEALGLGHAVLMAKDAVGNEPFAVLLGDDLIVSEVPCVKQLIKVYEQNNCSVIGVMEVPREEVSKYGIIGGEHLDPRTVRVSQMVEKPSPSDAPSQLACPGRYVLSPKIFKILENTKPGRGGEIQLTDALAQLATTDGLLAYLFEGTRYDTGDKLGFIEATIAFALSRDDLAEGTRKVLSKYLAG